MILQRWSERLRTTPRCITVHQEALRRIVVNAERAFPRETGGILLGYRTTSALVAIEAIEVRDPNATATRYKRDRRSAQQLLDSRLRDEPKSSVLGYIGDWHSHPADVAASAVDLSTLRENTLRDRDSLALIVVRHVASEWVEAGYVTSRPLPRWVPQPSAPKVFEVPLVSLCSEIQ